MNSSRLSVPFALQRSLLKMSASGPSATRLSGSFHPKRVQSTLSNDLPYNFITAASFIGKRAPAYQLEESQQQTDGSSGFHRWVERRKKEWARNYLQRNSTQKTPKYQRLTYSGQDWWFVHERNRGNFETFVGVADGVGGWLDSGIDPAEVSQGLMFYSDQFLENNNDKEVDESPNSILAEAYQSILKDDRIEGGASTALIAKLDPRDGNLQWTNLGDSTLLLIRPGQNKIIARTDPQTHYFNCPYQLSKFPQGYPASDGCVIDTPEMADCGTVSSLHDGDLVLLYTDGVGDNVWPEEILHLIKLTSLKQLPDLEFVNSLARVICEYARDASFSRTRESPFQVEAKRQANENCPGGKEDDVTLTISLARRVR